MSLKQYIPIYLLLALALPLSGAVDTRLVLVSNTHNTPIPGSGTLVLDLEAVSTSGTVNIRVFQNAFQLDAAFQAQVAAAGDVTFSEQLFPAADYTTTEDYRTSDGRVRYVYAYNSGSFATISTAYARILRITIVYTMAAAQGNINWFAGAPNYLVTDQANANITGIEEAIPALLTDISLPVTLSSFSAAPQDGKVVLNWVTQSEVNNLGFEVYRSGAENGNYALIASYQDTPSLLGVGNSNIAIEYRYEDSQVANGETYWYQLADVDLEGIRTFHGPVSVEAPDLLPEAFALHQNYPNPFNPETNIRFEVPADPANGRVELIIYNSLGMAVRTLVKGSIAPGIHVMQWDGRNDHGQQLASGIYFLRMQATGFSQARKMLLVR